MLTNLSVLPSDVGGATEVVGVVEEDVFFTDAVGNKAKATLCSIWGDRFAERYVFLYSGFCHNGS
ncbi:hypothetical protein [Bergeyella cardium]|uniref:hypothetical protein n=1 Tax=Bergeyella cardium TaxID=1585976 RepID=UPI001C87273E|nr:hypothetical protein [Bergeyella cardium]